MLFFICVIMQKLKNMCYLKKCVAFCVACDIIQSNVTKYTLIVVRLQTHKINA